MKKCIFKCAYLSVSILILLGILVCLSLKKQESIFNTINSENNILYQEIEREKNKNEEGTIKVAKETEEFANEEINIYKNNLWRIKIPKIRLDAPIAEGTSSEALRRTVGHFENTDKWTGNIALAAHNRGYKCNFFSEIKNLDNGDEIIYCTEKGERKYKVVINKIILETDWSYIENTKENRITLITCESGMKEYRRCIQAVEA